MQVTRRWQLPFGGRRGPEVEFPGEKGFVGGTIDDSAGFVTLGARQYDPELGRFLSVDPLMDLTDPQQMHGYTYSNNSPITYSDPSGLFFGWFKNVVSTVVKVVKQRYFQRPRWSGGGYSKKRSTRTAGYSRPGGGASGVGGVSVAQNSFWGDVGNWLVDAGEWIVDNGSDLGHLTLDGVGLVPGIGIVADGLNCAWYGLEGNGVDAGLSCAGALPGGQAATLTKWFGKGADAAGDAAGAGRRSGGGPPGCNSFVPGTGVLLADGSVKSIEEVGDRVWATDPETGEEGPRTVVATITSSGIKELVEITVDVDGADGDKTATVVATAEHPFWVDDQGHWLHADQLALGSELLTADGERFEVLSLD
ncbi:RHS repeat-associated core domain-containing protein [Saccharomonospora cyanea]|uniref:RHS repeat-associated core domain protein n=1 Tax=Saccharomonospora cyanea NA-134 TaxID=882082 RepID=H5XFG2_9PSEU|nr:RHS repeat-associated core domain-containing protein [Saccharomonospora cyanea]EHR62585.1 RHS repeat-associated core domain protein [Saccharomonospora cyanea NA-134]